MKPSKCIVCSNGDKQWRTEDGLLHREDGPAVIFPNGDRHWIINDELHREDGPAVEYFDEFGQPNHIEWWLEGESYTKQEYFELLSEERKEALLYSSEFMTNQ